MSTMDMNVDYIISLSVCECNTLTTFKLNRRKGGQSKQSIYIEVDGFLSLIVEYLAYKPYFKDRRAMLGRKEKCYLYT